MDRTNALGGASERHESRQDQIYISNPDTGSASAALKSTRRPDDLDTPVTPQHPISPWHSVRLQQTLQPAGRPGRLAQWPGRQGVHFQADRRNTAIITSDHLIWFRRAALASA